MEPLSVFDKHEEEAESERISTSSEENNGRGFKSDNYQNFEKEFYGKLLMILNSLS